MLVVLSCFGAALLWPSGGRAHTPITTKMLFNREVIRILKDNCLGCHRPGGISMSLASYEEARPWAKAIKEELLERRMPPWPAVKGFGDFSNAPVLTQRDVDAIVNWVEGGAPKGDAKYLPPGPLFSDDWSLGPPDLVLAPDAAHDVAADADERHELVLSTRVPAERWMTALDLRPGEASVVHCAALYLDGPRPALLGTWVPGSRAATLPDGVARRVPARARLRVRIHYRGSGQPAADRSAVGLHFAKTRAPRELRQLALTASSSSLRLAQAAEAVAIVPRADTRLASLQATVYRPDGTSEVLVWTRDHRDDWQPTYFFKKPVSVPKGSRVEVIVHLQKPDEERDGAGGVSERVAAAGAEPLLTLFYTTPSRDVARKSSIPGRAARSGPWQPPT